MKIETGAGVQFDHGRADAVRGLDLAAIGGDEDRDTAARLAQGSDEMGERVLLARDLEAALCGALLALLRHDEMGERVLLARDLEAALGGALLALLRHDTDCMRAMAQGDRLHLGGRGHLEVERQRQFRRQRGDIGVGDVAAILAQMHAR